MVKINPLISMGGKDWAIPIYPPIIMECAKQYNLSTYIEGTGAGARMLSNLEDGVFKRRIYNEWDRDFCAYFDCLSDSRQTIQLVKLIEQLVYKFDPKELFDLANYTLKSKECKTIDKTLLAAFAFIRSFGSHCGNRTGFNLSKFTDNILKDKRYLQLPEYNKVLQGTIVTNTDCFNLVKLYNNCSDFFYFGDHPYFSTSVYGDSRDWADARYIEFIEMAKSTKIKMMICDTINPFYDQLVDNYGWCKHFIKAKHNNAGGEQMLEHIWVNFDIPMHLLP